MSDLIPWEEKLRLALARRARITVVRDGFNPSAVLVPVYANRDERYVVLTKRVQWVFHHKGQVSFPGGAFDVMDEHLCVTALREASEEVGIRPEDVRLLGMLDDQATLTSNYIISPFVGVIPYPYEFRVNQNEVEALIKAPVGLLLEPRSCSPTTVDADGKVQPWYSYRCHEFEVTGITARILRQFLHVLVEAGVEIANP